MEVFKLKWQFRVNTAIMVLLMFIIGGSCAAESFDNPAFPQVAVNGKLSAAVNNPAGLNGLVTPEFSLKLQIDNEQSKAYEISYAEPNYGTGAGLLNFIYQESRIKATYGVAAQVLDSTGMGLALNYISYPDANNPDTSERYVSTDLGVQLGDFWRMRFGLLFKNIWHLPLGETETPLAVNIITGIAVDLGGYGILTIELDDAFSLDQGQKLFLGVEASPIENLRLRAGLEPQGSDWTVGIGYSYQQVQLNYDWQQNKHQFGFGWRF